MLGDSLRRSRKLDRKPQRPAARSAPSLRWSRWLLAGLIALVVSFGVGYGVAVWALFPVPDVATGDATPMPRLVGLELTEAQQRIEALGLAVGGITWLPHSRESAGRVIAQAPLPDQQLMPGGEVRLAVSSGRAQAMVPDIIGLPYATAEELARRLGFEVNRVTETAPGPEGLVLRIMPRPGTERVLPSSLTLVVSESPPEPVRPDSAVMGIERDAPALPPLSGHAGSMGTER